MDKFKLKEDYNKVCLILGFDVREYDKMLAKNQEKDDYHGTELKPIYDNKWAKDVFMHACDIYYHDPKSFKAMYEE